MTVNSTSFTVEIARAVDQVCSSLYTQMFQKVAREEPHYLSNEQRTILMYYPNEITWYKGNKREEIIERIRRTHLKWFNSWLSKQYTGLPPYIKWSSVMNDIMLHATNLLFRMDLDDVITSNDTRHAFQQITNTIKRILLNISKSNPTTIDPAIVPLVREFLLILFYFTLDSKLVIYLKSLQLVDLMNVLIRKSNNDDEVHLQAYRILAVIMTEADIKQLQISNRITIVFITFIKKAIDGGVPYVARLHNSLRSLKVLTQHDQIREELIKQGGHSLFLRCALEDQFNPLKAKLPALEILLALVFHKEFATILKNNDTFMNHIRTLTSSSQQDLQLIATALIWKLEKEPETIIKTVQQQQQPSSISSLMIDKKQYDIMISYSHSDKTLCHRILSSLEKDQLCVWIDSRLMHGATFDVMAKAIENAEFVLVCMSDAYKQNPLCEMEASYAVKCQCHIISLVMTPKYKADGWLGVLTSALIYIDFPKLGFDKAYQELKKQIELFRIDNSSSTFAEQDEVHHNSSSLVDNTSEIVPSEENNEEPCSVLKYPHCIDMWTEDHVKSFLLDKELDAFLPILEGMNGKLLHQAYSMCQTNQQGMFLSLKEDVNRSQHAILSLKDYLTFLEEIKIYIPFTANNSLNPISTVCNLI
ncbi:unnamed protein product [Rotaria sordida]|uniref:TIR domain-containing protein n=1 Tax=Rotaria sordida TaxID=392033 RepID=A0A814ZE96_9BILA|nr:unnamed protein product [Rotaria sordida]